MSGKMEKGMDARYLTELEPALNNKYGAEKTISILEYAWKRYEVICREISSEPKKMWMHTRKRIYPARAAFDAMTTEGISREEAEELLVNYYLDRARPVGEKIKKLMKIPGLYKLVPGFFAKMTKSSFGDGAGFKSEWKRADKNGMAFNMTVCPYQDACVKYGCPEIVLNCRFWSRRKRNE